uniref:Dehydrogenase/reductase 2 n=1 Tax=Loxodonta africana TaxID=9785 RepID=G3TJ09_LOXAF
RYSSGTDQRGLLANKVAVVSETTEGIGFAVPRCLAQDGAHVVVSSQKQQNVDCAMATLWGEGLSVTGTVCHVGKAEDQEQLVATALEHCGGVDFLVCYAEVNPLVGSTLGASEQVWDKVRPPPPTPPAVLTPNFSKRNGQSGAVILVSSVLAYIPHVELGAYNRKTALLGLTRTLALELAPKDIWVNCLVPGIIKTDFSKILHKDEAAWKHFKEDHQVRRNGWPEDYALIVSFLCSSDASYITGESIIVAGFSPRL